MGKKSTFLEELMKMAACKTRLVSITLLLMNSAMLLFMEPYHSQLLVIQPPLLRNKE